LAKNVNPEVSEKVILKTYPHKKLTEKFLLIISAVIIILY